MIKTVFISILCFCASLNSSTEAIPPNHSCLTINLICADRSGLAKDRIILQTALEELDCNVNWYNSDQPIQAGLADINIFCEKLIPECFNKAQLNWFIPNPEWLWHGLDLLNSVDLILCRTLEVERIFKQLKMKTYYLGFTSPDHQNQQIHKDYSKFLHIAGTSWQKGTLPIFRTWEKNPEFPPLTIIRFAEPHSTPPTNVSWITDWLPEHQLRSLQNSSGIHICLSETEGFGHALMESMSTGAILVTTDAPPMNEFIEDPRCLAAYSSWSTQNLGVTYFVNSTSIESKVKALLRLPKSELKEIGKCNRQRYLQYRKIFHSKLTKLINQIREDKVNYLN